MQELAKIAVLYAAGALVLVAEMFVPSSGILLVLGLGLFGWGLYEAFTISLGFGVINAVMLMVVLPTAMILAVRNWHRTPMGRRISPPNPKLGEQDRLPVSDLKLLAFEHVDEIAARGYEASIDAIRAWSKEPR